MSSYCSSGGDGKNTTEWKTHDNKRHNPFTRVAFRDDHEDNDDNSNDKKVFEGSGSHGMYFRINGELIYSR